MRFYALYAEEATPCYHPTQGDAARALRSLGKTNVYAGRTSWIEEVVVDTSKAGVLGLLRSGRPALVPIEKPRRFKLTRRGGVQLWDPEA